jgi:hypothetical protein
MATLKGFRDIPPGGWRYVQPETAVWFRADTFDELRERVKVHREYKGISIETLDLDIQRQLCLRLGPEFCTPEPGEDYRPVKDLSASLTTSMAVSFGKFLMAHIAAGGEMVSKEEAERRAAICRGCPFNTPAALCSCSAAYKAIELAVPKDRKVEGVSVCSACGCSLQLKVNVPIDVIAKSLPPDTVLPPWCWQKSAQTLVEYPETR